MISNNTELPYKSRYTTHVISQAARYLLILAALTTLCVSQTSAQVTTLLRNDGDLGDAVPGTVYVGDQNDLYIIPGSAGTQVVSTSTWTAVLTAPSGQVINMNLGADSYLHLTLGQLGTITITGTFTYMASSSGPGAAPNSVSATITVTPPTGVTFDADDSPANTAQFGIFGAGAFYYFQVLGGEWNNGYNMIAEEMISTTIPTGVPPAFGGGWGWAAGGPNNNAPDINMGTTGMIQDLKICNTNDQTVAVGGILYQYTQTIGVQVANMDNTIANITLGSFTISHIRASDMTYTTTVQQN